MTNRKGLRRAWSSLRGPRTPGLLDARRASTAGPYDHLEEPEPGWGPGGEEAARQRVSPAQRDPCEGGRGRRSRSLRARRADSHAGGEGKEAAAPGGVAGEVATVATPQPLGPADDGQLLLGETQGHRMRKGKKQVTRALQRGWETFMANIHSLTLSRPTSATSLA